MYRSNIRPTRHKRRSSSKRRIIIASLALVGAFIVLNAGIFALYANRTYPKTRLMGTTIGSVSYGALADHIRGQKLLPDQITLRQGDKTVQVATQDLGINIDTSPTIVSAKAQRSWLPIVALIQPPALAAPIRFDAAAFNTKVADLVPQFATKPTDAKLVLDKGRLSITPDTPGTTLDQQKLQTAIRQALAQGQTAVTVPTQPVAAKVQTGQLKAIQQKIDRQISTRITLRYGGKTFEPTQAEKGGWLEGSGTEYVISTDAIASTVLTAGKQLGVWPKGNYQIATDIAAAMQAGTPYQTDLTAAAPKKTITYCTAVRDVPSSELPGLREKAAITYADSRGWSLNGDVAYKHVESGCDFTLWLTAAAKMPTFGAICDSMWSCRVGPNVVINYDRWQHASPAWNEYGGSLTQYRDMVINHETGHWLGFDHDHCPGAGQQAPVMQQQSINLQGCTFSPWPNSNEIATYRRSVGL